MHVPHECYQRARASGSSSSSSNASGSRRPIAASANTDHEVPGRRERPSILMNPPNAFHRYAPFPPSPVSLSTSPHALSRGRASPSGGRVSPIDARTNVNLYKTAYSYPPPPPPAPLEQQPSTHPKGHPRAVAKGGRHSHTPQGVHLPPLSVPSHAHSSSSTANASITSSPSSQLPSLSHSATTATPTPTTASPRTHGYPLPPPTSFPPSPDPSYCASPMSSMTPPPSMDFELGKEKERDIRALVPLAALRLSDAQPSAGLSVGRKRYRMDEEALRAFKSF